MRGTALTAPAPLGRRRRGTKHRAATALLVACALVAGACASDDDGDDTATEIEAGVRMLAADVERLPGDETAARDAAASVNALGLDLWGQLVEPDANAALSPYSVAAALAMTRAGAGGVTADEMDAVMQATDLADLHLAFGSLDGELAERPMVLPQPEGDDQELELSFGNAVWPQEGFEMKDPFLETLGSHYGAGVFPLDYVENAEAARERINGWVSEQTKERIPELIPAGVLGALTRLVLTNAVYLNAPWLHPFRDSGTAPAPFTLLDGAEVERDLMSVSDQFGYAAGDGWQAAQLPYVGEELAMTVLVPDAGAFVELHDALDLVLVEDVQQAMQTTPVDLRLPTWEFRTQIGLNDALIALGMESAFDDRADFSGISDEPLFIAAVLHEVFVSVDEEGTEAAAATAVVMAETAAPAGEPVELTVDRPFLFWITDVPTGAILFLGQVLDPGASG